MPNQNPNPNQKPITNPELVEALKALHQENTPQNQGKVLGLGGAGRLPDPRRGHPRPPAAGTG